MEESKTQDIVFGIDLGTTNTVISYFKGCKINILQDGAFKLIPSKIYFSENKIFCGNYIPIGATNVINSFKVLIGNNYSITRNNKEYNISDILNIFISHLKHLIVKKFPLLKSPQTVITVPSNFSDTQREIIRAAFINNSFDVIRIINEPSAAALSYGLKEKGEKKIMVIDTGGGTMDITILQKDDNFFEVIHSIGLNDLGGNNFTNCIMNDIIKKNPDIKENDTLFYSAQRMKEKLSYLENFQINLKPYLGFDSYYSLNERDFHKLANKLLNRIDELISDILQKYEDIEYFILVGGSSKMKILQEKIYDITRKKPWIHPNLESVVSEGAAIYAAIITNLYQDIEDVLLVDILPLSLGVETADGNFSVIIPKDTPLPAKRTQKYTTDSPGDNVIKVKIYQGERKIADKNILIGEIEFDKVSDCGMPVIDITFKVDLNGIINIVILDKKSGIDKSVLLKDIPKYDEDALNKILKEAELNNDADEEMNSKLQRMYIIKVKIENALINLNINDFLSEEIKNDIRKELNEIEEKLESLQNHELLEIIENLDEKYSGLTQSLEINDNDNNDDKKMDDLEKVLMNELKGDIRRRAEILLVQNPEWQEYIKPLIDELEFTNLTNDYLNEKLKILKELQEDDSEERNYREELKNICIYIKSEIEEGQIELMTEKKDNLSFIILNNLELIEKDELLENSVKIEESVDNKTENILDLEQKMKDFHKINWEDKLNIFNKACEVIYSTNHEEETLEK
jgi:molecular chaperone DnaK